MINNILVFVSKEIFLMGDKSNSSFVNPLNEIKGAKDNKVSKKNKIKM